MRLSDKLIRRLVCLLLDRISLKHAAAPKAKRGRKAAAA